MIYEKRAGIPRDSIAARLYDQFFATWVIEIALNQTRIIRRLICRRQGDGGATHDDGQSTGRE